MVPCSAGGLFEVCDINKNCVAWPLGRGESGVTGRSKGLRVGCISSPILGVGSNARTDNEK